MQYSLQAANLKAELADKGDRVLLCTSWQPLNEGGSNFRSKRLIVQPSGDGVVIKSTFRARIFYGLLFLIGGAAIFLGLPYHLFVTGLVEGAVFMFLLGSLFIGVTYGLLMDETTVYIDRSNGVSLAKFPGFAFQKRKHVAQVSDIHALQILSELVIDDDNGNDTRHDNFVSYELNLILKNGQRIHLLDHSGLAKIEEEASYLEKWLGVDVWLLLND